LQKATTLAALTRKLATVGYGKTRLVEFVSQYFIVPKELARIPASSCFGYVGSVALSNDIQ